MKKTYIIPSTAIQQTYSLNAICVGSVHGNSGMKYGGGATSGSGISPI